MGVCENVQSIPLKEIRSPVLYWQAAGSDCNQTKEFTKEEYQEYLGNFISFDNKGYQENWERFSCANIRFNESYWIGRTFTDFLIDGAVAGFTAIARMASKLSSPRPGPIYLFYGLAELSLVGGSVLQHAWETKGISIDSVDRARDLILGKGVKHLLGALIMTYFSGRHLASLYELPLLVPIDFVVNKGYDAIARSVLS